MITINKIKKNINPSDYYKNQKDYININVAHKKMIQSILDELELKSSKKSIVIEKIFDYVFSDEQRLKELVEKLNNNN
ncbi:hypothetical protein [Arcobacter sp. 15-2]|uniref:hypothetical protein n=1 Tax=Arcobacter sp. 15-2 TaxID=3374109 RepID=UPI00399D3B0D